MCAVGQRIRERATAGLSPFLLVVGVAVASAGQNVPARADVQNEATWAFLRARNARDYAIVTPNGIDEGQYVQVGGIQQWITIRGEDRNNPVLLFLHGGPGDATNPWGYAGFRLWLRHFTVVQWDQRGAGRTLGNNRAAPLHDMTVARMTKDGVELADILRKQLRKDKIVLVGHSWGSILGVLMVKARPDLFYAFVGTGQVADPATSYAVSHRELLRKAERSRTNAPFESCSTLGRRRIPTAVDTACSANGRISSRARTRSSHRWWASPLLRRVTRCAMSTTGSTVRMPVLSAWCRKRARSTRERLAASSRLRSS
jgi:pimeloyl-ACP methyl ester carboxylesterase